WRARRSTAKALGRLQAVEAVRPRCGDDPEAPLARKQRVKALYAALETLPDPLRLAFVLRDLQGMSPEAAARSLGISQNNLSVRACRARERLRKILSQEGPSCPGSAS
ncbi:MAG TPA: sigma-70 family RNA polymerase sigma factor, partial [Nannocystis exedens]|nr:sigma-70 family RNA polymerase sigma factor [Nannocystis exedens]